MSRITVVGCGMMGGNIADAFLDAGHEVTIVDLDPSAARPRLERGAHFSEALSDALDAGFVLFSLPTNSAVRAVISECPSGSLSGKILINTTSEAPSEVLLLESELRALGARYIDATILTYQGEVGRDDACLLYSGDREAFEEVVGDLRALSPNPLFLGDGVSVAAEIVDIVVVAGHYGLVYAPLEGVARCVRCGISVDEYLGALDELLVEIAERALPEIGLASSAVLEGDGGRNDLMGLMRHLGVFDHLSPGWLKETNRGVAAHLSKVIAAATPNFTH